MSLNPSGMKMALELLHRLSNCTFVSIFCNIVFDLMLIKFESGKYHDRLAQTEMYHFNVHETESLADRLVENT